MKIRDKITIFGIRVRILFYEALDFFIQRWGSEAWHNLIVIYLRELMIAEALCTDEGKQALAISMVEPIRRALDYQGIGRRLLMVDELPQGAYASYAVVNNSSSTVFSSTYSLAPDVMNRVGDEAQEDIMRRYRETLAETQARLANTPNDPNLIFDTFTGFRNQDIVGIGHIWSDDIYVSDPHHFISHGRQEDALYEYLIWCKELKTQEKMADRRKQVKNPIIEMELGG